MSAHPPPPPRAPFRPFPRNNPNPPSILIRFFLAFFRRTLHQYTSPLPHTYVKPEDLPDFFTWTNIGGHSMVTKNLNQHIPVYCGSW